MLDNLATLLSEATDLARQAEQLERKLTPEVVKIRQNAGPEHKELTDRMDEELRKLKEKKAELRQLKNDMKK